MLQLKRLYSELNPDGRPYFKTVPFRDGINLICGEESVDDEGRIQSQKRNGSGKSLTIELINFCFLKKLHESKVNRIPEKNLPLSAYVSLDVTINGQNLTISRNRHDKVKIKKNGQDEKEYTFHTAKIELNNLFKIAKNTLTARSYLNFIIKEADYTYSNFLRLYNGPTYLDFLKMHFYLFGINIFLLQEINNLQDDYELTVKDKKKVERLLEAKGIGLPDLRAEQNNLKIEIERLEEALDYSSVAKNVENAQFDLSREEKVLQGLIDQRNELKIESNSITKFLSDFKEDLEIDELDLQVFFNKYSKGLGDYIKHDFDELKEFRSQIWNFKNELFVSKRKSFSEAIEKLDLLINDKIEEISKLSGVSVEGKNFLQKNFTLYRGQTEVYQANKEMIVRFDKADEEMSKVVANYSNKINHLRNEVKKTTEVQNSFFQDFSNIHHKIFKNKKCNFAFKISSNPRISDAKFFDFDVTVAQSGSTGTDRTRAVIYDFALLVNEFTKGRFGGCIIHDELLGGAMDIEASMEILKYANSLDEQQFQYISTVNTDIFANRDDDELKSIFKDSNVAIRLSIEDPLFYEQFY